MLEKNWGFLEMHISEFINPLEFQHFCSMLFSAEFDEFQSIDDSGGDLGIDGYVQNDKIFQFYCREKPQKITDKDIKQKIEESIKKVIKTICDRNLNIQTFIFVTPDNLRSDVILYLEEKSKENGLKGISYGETKLTELLAKHPHVQKQFPFFLLPDISSQIEDLSKDVKYIKYVMQGKAIKLDEVDGGESLFVKSVKLKESFDAYNKGDFEQFIGLSKEVYYESSDSKVKLQAILNVTLNDVDIGKISYYVNLCDEGIALSKKLNSIGTAAILKAKKANLIQWETDFLLQELWFSEQIAKQIGIFNEIEYLAKEKTYNEKLGLVTKLFQEAIQAVYENKSYDNLANIYTLAGMSAGTSYICVKTIRPSFAGKYESICKTAYNEARLIYEKLGDNYGKLNVKHNLANALVSFGEKELAKKYAEEVYQEAKKSNFSMIELKSKELLYSIENFTLEDYKIPPHEFIEKLKNRRIKMKEYQIKDK